MAKESKKESKKEDVIKVDLIVTKMDGDKATLKLVETETPHGIITMGNHGIEIALDKLPEKFNSEEHILTGTLTIVLDIEDKPKIKTQKEIEEGEE